MNCDDVIRDALIARIDQLTAQNVELELQLKKARNMIWDLSVPVNNLISLGDERHKIQCRALLDAAKEFNA